MLSGRLQRLAHFAPLDVLHGRGAAERFVAIIWAVPSAVFSTVLSLESFSRIAVGAIGVVDRTAPPGPILVDVELGHESLLFV